MSDILEFIEKNAEGVDLEEAKKLVSGYIKKPDNKEEAEKMIEEVQQIKSVLDSRISKSVEHATERFKESKLPEILKEEKEKIRAELQPQETEEQKRIRELQEKISSFEKEKQIESKKAELRAKAKELGFDPLKAERYAVYGDEATDILSKDVEDINGLVNSKVEEMIKTKYGGHAPDAPGEKKQNTMLRSEFEKLSPAEQMEKAKAKIKLIDE